MFRPKKHRKKIKKTAAALCTQVQVAYVYKAAAFVKDGY